MFFEDLAPASLCISMPARTLRSRGPTTKKLDAGRQPIRGTTARWSVLAHGFTRMLVLADRAASRGHLGKHVHPHMLRHTYASHLAMRGVGLRVVQELLGHATLEMTMRYAHLSPDHKAEAVQVLARDHLRVLEGGKRGPRTGRQLAGYGGTK